MDFMLRFLRTETTAVIGINEGEDMTYLYEYRQSNSGGSFDSGDGLALNVLIEAKNADQANEIAYEIGIDGSDYNCCGDRWYEADEDDRYETMEDVWKGVTNSSLRLNRVFNANPLAIHYLDGRVIEMDHDQYEKAYKAYKESKRKK